MYSAVITGQYVYYLLLIKYSKYWYPLQLSIKYGAI